MLVWQRAIHDEQHGGAQQNGRSHRQPRAPGAHALAFGRRDARGHQRKRAGRQHDAGAEAEHAVLDLLRNGAGEQNGQGAQRGGGGGHQAAQQCVSYVRRAHIQIGPQLVQSQA
ncbi:hypothetical protein D3C87_1460980 [compost metagenome]